MSVRPLSTVVRPLTAVLAVFVLGAVVWWWTSENKENAPADAVPAGNAVQADLAKAARTRVFFGHQSVGRNLLDGVPAVYREYNLAAPAVIEGTMPSGEKAGVIIHASIGQNENPLSKLQDFDRMIRSGIGDHVDVAMMKFCWIDFTTSTDVNALFIAYQNTMAALEKDYPTVTFVKVTVPLMTNPGMLSKIKNVVTGGTPFGTRENVVREQFNTLMRQQYADDNLFDLAALESTAPDGRRVVGTLGGRTYYALYDGYASDRGHLNAAGQKRIAEAWLRFIAKVSTR